MSTTLDIADDVLQAAKELAQREKTTTGTVISELARSALTASPRTLNTRETKSLHGLRPFPNAAAL